MTRQIWDKGELGHLTKIGSGGQASVYAVGSGGAGDLPTGPLVFKEYKASIRREYAPQILNGMPDLIKFAQEASPDDQTFLRRYTVWPQGLVRQDGEARGILMKLIPDPYWFDLKRVGLPPKRTLLEIQHVLRHRDTHAEFGIPPVLRSNLMLMCVHLLDVVVFLHEHNLVIGDFSAKNTFITNPDRVQLGRQGAVMPKLLDVDSFRFTSSTAPIPQAHTPNWIPPEAYAHKMNVAELTKRGAPQTAINSEVTAAAMQNQASDMFKFGLLMLRMFHDPPSVEDDDTQSVYESESATRRLQKALGPRRAAAILATLATRPGARPTAAQLRAELKGK